MSKEEINEYLMTFVTSFPDGKPEDVQSWTENKGLSVEAVGPILMFAYEKQQYDRDILFTGIAEAIEDIRKQETDHVNRSYEILRRNFRKACVLEPSPKRAEMIHQDAFDILVFLEEEVGKFPMTERLNAFIKAAVDVAKRTGMEVPDDFYGGK